MRIFNALVRTITSPIEISVEDMQKIVDANEKLIKELKDVTS